MAEIVWGNVLARWTGYTEIGSIFLDASVEETHSMSSEVSSHTIEDGSDVTDHIHNNPRTVTIDGRVTNHPLDDFVLKASGSGVRAVQKTFEWKAQPKIPILPVQVGGPGIIGGVTGAIASVAGADIHKGTALGFEPSFDRVHDVLEEFEAIRKEKRVITIVTTLKVYTNMVLTSLDINRNAGSANSLPFTATAEQISLVETGIVPALPQPTVKRAFPENKKGNQNAQDASDASNEALESIAFKGLGL